MILLIIGTSSTGKSTLSHILQTKLPGYWHYMALDLMFKGVPADYAGGDQGQWADQGFAYTSMTETAAITAGEWGHRVLAGMVASAVEMNRQGVNVIFDDMLIDLHHADLWKTALSGIDHFIVRLVASKPVLLERIGPRSTPNGVALNHIDQNTLLEAHLELDTEVLKPEVAAQQVLSSINLDKIHHL